MHTHTHLSVYISSLPDSNLWWMSGWGWSTTHLLCITASAGCGALVHKDINTACPCRDKLLPVHAQNIFSLPRAGTHICRYREKRGFQEIIRHSTGKLLLIPLCVCHFRSGAVWTATPYLIFPGQSWVGFPPLLIASAPWSPKSASVLHPSSAQPSDQWCSCRQLPSMFFVLVYWSRFCLSPSETTSTTVQLFPVLVTVFTFQPSTILYCTIESSSKTWVLFWVNNHVLHYGTFLATYYTMT